MLPAAPASQTAPIGVFGGMFDPVHHGHLRTALELLERCALAAVRFVPCGQPPHRPPPAAGVALRADMLRAALAGEPRFVLDERELHRPGPSYMVDTLASLRAELGPVPLCLLLGADAFLGLPGWHRWEELPGLAHLIVVRRPGWELPAAGPLARLTSERLAQSPTQLSARPAGLVLTQSVTQLEIASSAIRALVAAGGDPRFLVPERVRELMLGSGCYGPPRRGAADPTEAQVRA